MNDATQQQAAPASTAVATKPASEFDTLRGLLAKMEPEFRAALPQHLPVERFMRIVLTSVRNTPKLMKCDRRSFFAAVMTAAQLGLEPDGVTGQAYLVPFGDQVTFIPGYRGLISLARNSGELMDISAHEVYEKDEFDIEYGFANNIIHKPPLRGERGPLIGFYACARFNPPKGSQPGTDGGRVFEYMTVEQVEAVRDASQGYRAFKAGKIKTNPWHTAFIEMGRKTLIRRIAKYLPLSVQKASFLDEAAERGATAHMEYGEVIVDNDTGEIVEDTGASDAAKVADGGATAATNKLEEAGARRGRKPKNKDANAPAAGSSPPTAAASGAAQEAGSPQSPPPAAQSAPLPNAGATPTGAPAGAAGATPGEPARQAPVAAANPSASDAGTSDDDDLFGDTN